MKEREFGSSRVQEFGSSAGNLHHEQLGCEVTHLRVRNRHRSLDELEGARSLGAAEGDRSSLAILCRSDIRAGRIVIFKTPGVPSGSGQAEAGLHPGAYHALGAPLRCYLLKMP
jgi:hypothetical protein